MKKETIKDVIAKKKAAKKNVASRKEVAAKRIAARQEATKKASVLGERLAAKLDARMEKILLDAERLVKDHVPARFVSASLTRLQKQLIAQGIGCKFDKRVSKEAIKRTANTDVTIDDCNEAIDKIAEIVVGLTEETLDDCDNCIHRLAKKHFVDHRVSTIKAMRNTVETKMKATGLNIKL